VGKIAWEKRTWGQSPQGPKANWDLKREPPELGEFSHIFSKK